MNKKKKKNIDNILKQTKKTLVNTKKLLCVSQLYKEKNEQSQQVLQTAAVRENLHSMGKKRKKKWKFYTNEKKMTW